MSGTVKVEDHLARIAEAPRGPKIAAFFDYDGTVITGYSASAFYRKRIREREIGPIELAETLWMNLLGIRTEKEFAEMLDLSLASWRGRTEEEMERLGASLFRDEVASQLHTEVWQIVEAHRAAGHTIVLASSATRYQLAPIGRDLRADHLLYTRLEVVDGKLTGRPEGIPLWGLGKARAVRALAAAHDIDLRASFGYANGDEDVLFLESVGNPTAVSPGRGLRDEAATRGWPVLQCKPRGKGPGLTDVLRTAAFYGGVAAGAGTGLGLGLLNRSKRQAVDLSLALATDMGLALAGVDVKVISGAEHLWSARPCLFLINHQSKMDPFLFAKIVRSGFTGVMKAEAKNVPGFGQLFQFADVAFIDRGNFAQAKDALAGAVTKLKEEGLSIAMSPEGTRSATPALGEFKKGAFHIAMQAGVPIVPVVFRNAGEIQWRGAQTIRPGTVETVVLPPVDTSGWSVKTLNEHVAEVRGMYLDTLARWPGSESSKQEDA
ncbi:MAG TPA: HAD-IB family hydrolase [Pseudonocardia sp.]|jgi:putative phosphoserine phosphatase/1-acylglycerol-3-phosphate O-acyltransferase|nr:HAD-IB family hydrolase [Pseudonocardia sp.]